MVDPETISDLGKAFSRSPQGFLVVDSGVPRFAVLPYETYQNLKMKNNPKKSAKKILVTGGAGYIGSCTVKVLQDAGYEVIVYDNLSTGSRSAVKNARLVAADLAETHALDKVFTDEKIDAVIHFAASISVPESVANPAKYFENNVANGLNLLNAMVKHGVSRLVFSSTAAVYGEPAESPVNEQAPCRPTNPYGETKLTFERILQNYLEAYGVSSASLRYFNAAGALPEAGLGYRHDKDEPHLIPRVLDVAAGKAPEIEVFGQDYDTPDGTCVRDYIHVSDLAAAHVLALEKLARDRGSFVYNLGSGRGYSVLEVIDAAVELTGRMIPMNFGPRRPGDPAKLVASSAKVASELGWRPKQDLQAILASSWQWHQAIIS